MNWKEWLQKKEGRRDWFGLAFPLLLGLGVIFLLLSNTHISEEETEEGSRNTLHTEAQSVAGYEAQLARQLEQALGHIKGAGTVYVALTLEDDGEVAVLQDEERTVLSEEQTASSGESRLTRQEEQRTETVRDAPGNPYVLKERQPKVRGVLVLAEGAGSSVIRQELLAAVQALLDVSAQNVHIAPYH